MDTTSSRLEELNEKLEQLMALLADANPNHAETVTVLGSIGHWLAALKPGDLPSDSLARLSETTLFVLENLPEWAAPKVGNAYVEPLAAVLKGLLRCINHGGMGSAERDALEKRLRLVTQKLDLLENELLRTAFTGELTSAASSAASGQTKSSDNNKG